jgi:hypothetical protein
LGEIGGALKNGHSELLSVPDRVTRLVYRRTGESVDLRIVERF